MGISSIQTLDEGGDFDAESDAGTAIAYLGCVE